MKDDFAALFEHERRLCLPVRREGPLRRDVHCGGIPGLPAVARQALRGLPRGARAVARRRHGQGEHGLVETPALCLYARQCWSTEV